MAALTSARVSRHFPSLKLRFLLTVRAALIAVRTAFITAQKSRLYGAFISAGTNFSGLYGQQLTWHRNTEGCTAGLLSTFPDFEIKFAGGDKLFFFSPFSVLYIAEEIIKISPLSDWFSPWGFFQG